MNDPFELIGKSMLVIMPQKAFEATFTMGKEVAGMSDQEGPWTVGGVVVGEVPNLGIWLQLHSLTSPAGKLKLISESGQDRPTYLVRWDYIMSARLDPVDLKQLGRIGFSPLLS